MDPNRVLIFDTTLRDGEQSPGISLNTTGEARDRAPARAARRRRHRGRLPDRLAGRLRGRPGDRPRGRGPGHLPAWRARQRGRHRAPRGTRSSDAERPRIHTFIATSDIHIEHQLQTTREDVKGQARAAVAQARELLRRRRVLAEDAHALGRRVHGRGAARSRIDEGATTINIPDTVGYTMPRRVRGVSSSSSTSWCPSLRDVVVSVALPRRPRASRSRTRSPASQAGARQVECAINGIGERAGNASLEEIVMLLHTREPSLGLRHGHRHDRDRAHEPARLAPDRLLRCSRTRRSSGATRSRTSPASTRTAC